MLLMPRSWYFKSLGAEPLVRSSLSLYAVLPLRLRSFSCSACIPVPRLVAISCLPSPSLTFPHHLLSYLTSPVACLSFVANAGGPDRMRQD